ncbi:MAG: hypothetical protein KY463_12420 [Actinobacteria bacterium]|nr:hypothetical protein [Actinomycetota bacterium]
MLTENNQIYDNWRYGAMLFFVEAYFRGEDDPAQQDDTSHYNKFLHNRMGIAPGGRALPNGTDFWWDEFLSNRGNCWYDNTGPGGTAAGITGPGDAGEIGLDVAGDLLLDGGASISTLAVEGDSKLGLQGTLDVLQELTGAESIRQLPTLKLFKIRMDLEMQGDTKSLSTEGVAEEPVELEGVPYDELDVAVVRATQGDLPVVSRPYAPAAAELGMTEAELLEHMAAMKERGILRRVAAILYHRRAGFSANGMGVWAVPEEKIAEFGPRMASFRGISHCYQRPTYEDWPYSIFTMAHGRSKEECDAILDAIAGEFAITQRATLYSSTEFKKIRLLYFTDDFKNWEAQHAGAA